MFSNTERPSKDRTSIFIKLIRIALITLNKQITNIRQFHSPPSRHLQLALNQDPGHNLHHYIPSHNPNLHNFSHNPNNHNFNHHPCAFPCGFAFIIQGLITSFHLGRNIDHRGHHRALACASQEYHSIPTQGYIHYIILFIGIIFVPNKFHYLLFSKRIYELRMASLVVRFLVRQKPDELLGEFYYLLICKHRLN